jgi:hypothetical protein
MRSTPELASVDRYSGRGARGGVADLVEEHDQRWIEGAVEVDVAVDGVEDRADGAGEDGAELALFLGWGGDGEGVLPGAAEEPVEVGEGAGGGVAALLGGPGAEDGVGGGVDGPDGRVGLVPHALHTAERRAGQGVKAGVLHVRTVKPLDRAALIAQAQRVPLVVTVEEHLLSGGFGSAVLEALSDGMGASMPVVARAGLPDAFQPPPRRPDSESARPLPGTRPAGPFVGRCRTSPHRPPSRGISQGLGGFELGARCRLSRAPDRTTDPDGDLRGVPRC